MDFLTQLGIPHTAALGPSGALIVFPHVAHQRQAHAYLISAGFPVIARPGRALFIPAPVELTWRQRHPVAYRWLLGWAVLTSLAVWYISVPLYAYLGIRWYVRRNGRPRAMRPGIGKRRAPRPAGYYAGSPAMPRYADHK